MEEEIKNSSNKQVVNLNFLSIFVSHFCWSDKKNNRFLDKVSLSP